MLQPGLDAFTFIAILIITLIILIYLAWMVRYKAKAKERLFIIEKDFDMHKLLKEKKSSFSLLKTGIILVSTAIGAVVGILVLSLISKGAIGGILFFTSIFMFAGIGMIIANKLDTSKKEE